MKSWDKTASNTNMTTICVGKTRLSRDVGSLRWRSREMPSGTLWEGVTELRRPLDLEDEVMCRMALASATPPGLIGSPELFVVGIHTGDNDIT